MAPKISTKKPKVAIYIRVSTEEQAREGYSLSAQESALKDYIGMMGYDLFKIYRDEGKSAKDIKHRPALQQLLKDAEKKYFKAICVYKLDRFSRSLKDLILTIERLKLLNIDFISLQDKIETASASGKLMFHIISSFAEFERDIISERTRFGMTEKAKEGGIITKAPLGYKILDGKLVIDLENKDRVAVIFNEYASSDESLNTLAKKYDLSVPGLILLLHNKTYIGEIRFRESYQGIHESIIDKELFEKVQSKLQANKNDREHVRCVNMLERLKPDIKSECKEEITALVLSKEAVYEKISLFLVEEDPDIPDRIKNTIHKHLIEEGFNPDEITFDRVFVNADKTDIYADNGQKRIYIDMTTSNLEKLPSYIHNDIEYWIVQGKVDGLEVNKWKRKD